MIRRLTVMLCLVCSISLHATPPTVITLDRHVPAPIDATSPVGLWQMVGDGAIFYIEPERRDTYTLTLYDSPDLTLSKGALFGSMSLTASGSYDASLILNPKGSGRRKTRHFLFDIDTDGTTLTMRSYRKGARINVLRLLPYLFRLSISEVDTRPQNIDGAIRLSPPTAKFPVTL